MSMTPKTNYVALWARQITFKHTRNPKSFLEHITFGNLRISKTERIEKGTCWKMPLVMKGFEEFPEWCLQGIEVYRCSQKSLKTSNYLYYTKHTHAHNSKINQTISMKTQWKRLPRQIVHGWPQHPSMADLDPPAFSAFLEPHAKVAWEWGRMAMQQF